jgi:hypothetical protein
MWLRRRIQYIIPEATEEALRFHPLNFTLCHKGIAMAHEWDFLFLPPR